MPFSKGSFLPRDRTCLSYILGIGKQVLYHYHHLGSSRVLIMTLKKGFKSWGMLGNLC